MRTHVLGAMLVALFAGAASAAAQEQDVVFFRSGPLDPAVGQVGIAGPGARFEMAVDLLGVEPFDIGKPVTGAPYSAEITTEIVQQLADGNRIERRSTSSVARDGQGRVRREQQVTAIGPILPQGGASIVTINDPVAKVHYALDAARKVAIQMPMIFTTKLEGPGPTFDVKLEGPGPGPGAGLDVKLERRGAVLGSPAVNAFQAQDARTESLGTKEIEGVKAEGTRVMVAIPAGAIGNQAPIEIVSERWYSPELQTVVFSRRADPRFGETTYRLENIIRVEPPAELFQVPADYTVEEGKGLGVRKILPAPGQ